MASFHPHHPPEDCVNCEHRHLRMFCNLTPEALRDYDGIGIMMSHARGAKLFTEGDPARNVFVVCFGQVKISSTSRDGKTMILKIAGPGDVMGLSAVLANVPHEVTAEAIEPCHDAKRLALSGSAAGRLARLLLDWGHSVANGKPEIRFTMALTHEEIANMAGTSRETVTRLLNQFRRDQWITIKGASMTIVRPDQLEKLTA